MVNRQFHQNYFTWCPLSLFNGHPAANQNRVYTQTMVFIHVNAKLAITPVSSFSFLKHDFFLLRNRHSPKVATTNMCTKRFQTSSETWVIMICRKGIVYPEMNILSYTNSFTHPHVVPNLHDFILLLWKRMWLQNY